MDRFLIGFVRAPGDESLLVRFYPDLVGCGATREVLFRISRDGSLLVSFCPDFQI